MMVFKGKLRIFLLVFSLTILPNCVFSQSEPWTLSSAETTQCAYLHAAMDTIAQGLKTENVMKIVSYQGITEKKEAIKERRLHNAFIYFNNYYREQKIIKIPETIILKIANEPQKEGLLDFIIDDKPVLKLYFKQDRDFLFAPCYPDDYFDNDVRRLLHPKVGLVSKPDKSQEKPKKKIRKRKKTK